MTRRRWHGPLLLALAIGVIGASLAGCALPNPIPVAPKDQDQTLSRPADAGGGLDKPLKLIPEMGPTPADRSHYADATGGCPPSDAKVDGQCRPGDARSDALGDGKDLFTDAIKTKDGRSKDVEPGD